MHEKHVLLQIMVLGAIFLSLSGTTAQGQSEDPPNVLLIMTDDQGYGDLSRHGNPEIETPHLDQLHDQSVRFTNFHVSPYCTPTRASLLTGRYATRTGAWHTFGVRNLMHEDETTMAEVFQFNGYRTGQFGKWHLGINYPFAPHHRGFDVSFMLGNGGLGATDDYWGNDRFNDTYFLNGKPVHTQGFGTDRFVDRAIRFIKSTEEKPFFVYLATNIPHRPWNIPSEYVRQYAPRRKDPSNIVPYGYTDQARYNGTISKIDEQVGRIMRFLRDSNRAENTVVGFLTDNGTVNPGYNAGMRGKKGSVYEGGHRVPLFIRWPGKEFPSNQDVPELTAHVDLLPTFVDLLDLQLPEPIDFDGTSLAPPLKNNPSAWPENRIHFTSSIQPVPGYHLRPPKWKKSVVLKNNWRLINGEELYNIEADPSQENNVAENHPGIVKQLRNDYETYWKDIHPEAVRDVHYELGTPEQPVTTLTLMGIRSEKTVWGQHHVAKAVQINGSWPVEVMEDGLYEIELRRWPRELNRPINAGLNQPVNAGRAPGKRIHPEKAHLKIAGIERTRTIDPDRKAITFRLKLPEGQTDLQARFLDDDGSSRAAYYVYVKKSK